MNIIDKNHSEGLNILYQDCVNVLMNNGETRALSLIELFQNSENIDDISTIDSYQEFITKRWLSSLVSASIRNWYIEYENSFSNESEALVSFKEDLDTNEQVNIIISYLEDNDDNFQLDHRYCNTQTNAFGPVLKMTNPNDCGKYELFTCDSSRPLSHIEHGYVLPFILRNAFADWGPPQKSVKINDVDIKQSQMKTTIYSKGAISVFPDEENLWMTLLSSVTSESISIDNNNCPVWDMSMNMGSSYSPSGVLNYLTTPSKFISLEYANDKLASFCSHQLVDYVSSGKIKPLVSYAIKYDPFIARKSSKDGEVSFMRVLPTSIPSDLSILNMVISENKNPVARVIKERIDLSALSGERFPDDMIYSVYHSSPTNIYSSSIRYCAVDKVPVPVNSGIDNFQSVNDMRKLIDLFRNTIYFMVKSLNNIEQISYGTNNSKESDYFSMKDSLRSVENDVCRVIIREWKNTSKCKILCADALYSGFISKRNQLLSGKIKCIEIIDDKGMSKIFSSTTISEKFLHKLTQISGKQYSVNIDKSGFIASDFFMTLSNTKSHKESYSYKNAFISLSEKDMINQSTPPILRKVFPQYISLLDVSTEELAIRDSLSLCFIPDGIAQGGSNDVSDVINILYSRYGKSFIPHLNRLINSPDRLQLINNLKTILGMLNNHQGFKYEISYSSIACDLYRAYNGGNNSEIDNDYLSKQWTRKII